MINYNNENGRSMIEMLGVLAIIGVLSVGGIAGYSKAMHRYRINKLISQMTATIQNVRTFFSTQRNYADLLSAGSGNNSLIKKAKLVPDDMIDANGHFQIEYGSAFNLIATTDKQTNDTACLQFKLEKDACIDLLSYDWTDANVKYINIEGLGTKYPPISIDDAVTYCEKHYADSPIIDGLEFCFK